MSSIALRLAGAIVSLLPRRSMTMLGAVLGFVAGSLLRIRRAHVDAAMSRAAAEQNEATRMFRGLGRGIMDLLWLYGVSASKRERALRGESIGLETERILDDALAKGPVVFFASHTGNWEVVASAAAHHLGARKKKRRLAVVAKRVSARGVDAFMTRLRSLLGVATIAPHGAFSAACRALAKGDVVAMPIDQVPDRHTHATRVMFLGEEALVDRAPATLAWRARATILVVASHHGSSSVSVLDVIAPPSPSDRSHAWIEATTMRATKQLEGFVRSNPASWMWLHRRWNASRDLSTRRAATPKHPRTHAASA